MDHLSIPILSPVHCLCTIPSKPYVLGYPEDKGWVYENGKLTKKKGSASEKEIEAFFQEWLYFGLLTDAFKLAGIQVNLSDFSQKIKLGGRSIPVVTTSKLPEYLKRWEQLEQNSKVDRRREKQESLRLFLMPLNGFIQRQMSHDWSVKIDRDVMLSFCILGETLKNAAVHVWKLPLENYPLRGVKFLRNSNPLTDRMLQSGRCISETVMLWERLDVTGQYIAAAIPWARNTRIKNHDECTPAVCSAFHLDESTYKTAHTAECRKCQFLSLDGALLCAILEKGHIPMIHLDGDKLTVISTASQRPFIAFSHVWAHGLGNVADNALPLCQLRRLNALASSLLSTNSPFWIDTLCIPVNPAFKKYRSLAISRLGKTFSLASRTLVLDLELQQVPYPCSRNELATRLICSGWMRRLWTLQEAVISDGGPNLDRLWIQLRDGPISLYSIFKGGATSLLHSETAIHDILTHFPQQISSLHNLQTLSSALTYRSTSKQSDEAICLASILGLNVKSIIDAGSTVNDRMHSLFSQLDKLPVDILFHKVDCLPQPGYRWAPSTFLNLNLRNKISFQLDVPPAHRDSKGLHVQLSGLVVHTDHTRKPNENIGENFHFLDPRNREVLWQLSPPTSENVIFNLNRQTFLEHRSKVAEFDRNLRHVKVVGILLRDASQALVVHDGVLIALDDQRATPGKSKEIHGRYMSKIKIFRHLANAATTELEAQYGERLVATSWIERQNWCVS